MNDILHELGFGILVVTIVLITGVAGLILTSEASLEPSGNKKRKKKKKR